MGTIIRQRINYSGGLPTGGTTGQVLAKKSNTDQDVEWRDPGDFVFINVDFKDPNFEPSPILGPNVKTLVLSEDYDELKEQADSGKIVAIKLTNFLDDISTGGTGTLIPLECIYGDNNYSYFDGRILNIRQSSDTKEFRFRITFDDPDTILVVDSLTLPEADQKQFGRINLDINDFTHNADYTKYTWELPDDTIIKEISDYLLADRLLLAVVDNLHGSHLQIPMHSIDEGVFIGQHFLDSESFGLYCTTVWFEGEKGSYGTFTITIEAIDAGGGAELSPIQSSEGLIGMSIDQSTDHVSFTSVDTGVVLSIQDNSQMITKDLVDKSYIDTLETSLADIAFTGNVNDLIQTAGDVLILNCNDSDLLLFTNGDNLGV